MRQTLQVSGEDLDTLRGFFAHLETKRGRNGMLQVTAKDVPADVGIPFVRAVMRREARLMIADADGMDDESWEPRTPEQRRADAFADVLLSVVAAVRYIRRDGRSKAKVRG